MSNKDDLNKMTRTQITLLQGTVLALAIMVVYGCTGPGPGRFYVRIGPPAPVAEARIVSPGPGYVWVQGFHRWDGGSYQWVPGRWERPPRPRAEWAPARWEHGRRGWYFVEGHWR